MELQPQLGAEFPAQGSSVPPPAPRKTQRAPASCTECSKRRLRCSKTIPCERCVSKGIGDRCTREVVLVRGQVLGGKGDLPQRVESIDTLREENVGLRARIEELERLQGGSQSYPAPSAEAGTSLDTSLFQHDLSAVGVSVGDVIAADQGGPRKRARQATPERERERYPPTQGQKRSDLLALIPIDQSEELIQMSIKCVGWIHCAVHQTSFMAEHKEWLEKLKRGDEEAALNYPFLSVYFALLSTGSYFLGETLLKEDFNMPQLWFTAAIDALYLSSFMSIPRVETCQTICILTLVAHAFSESAHLLSLLHVGLYISQALGLHLLVQEPEGIPPPGLIQREIGRSVWSSLVLQEALSPAAQQPHALFISPGISAPQAHCDDIDVVEGKPLMSVPFHIQTRVSNRVVHTRLGKLSREFSLAFWTAKTVEAQYKIVEGADHTLLHILDDFPQLQPSDAPYMATLDVTLPVIDNTEWVRHHLTLALARMRIYLHRTFMSRALSDKRFMKSREICCESARAILKERARIVPAIFDRAWHVTSDTVAAGVILCLLAQEATDSYEKESLRHDVNSLISVLHKGGRNNVLVQRGVKLLSGLLAEAASPAPPPPLELVQPHAAPAPFDEPPLDWAQWTGVSIGTGFNTLGLEDVWTMVDFGQTFDTGVVVPPGLDLGLDWDPLYTAYDPFRPAM